MTFHLFRCSIVASLCLATSVVFAQSDPAPAPANAASKPAVSQATHPAARLPKKPRPEAKAPAGGSVSLMKSEEAEKAARLAEGRKKFFESSSGFGSDGRTLPMSIGNDGRPAMGFKF